MALTHHDFRLADDTLQRINDYIAACAQAYADAGEDAAGEITVTFT